MRQWKISETLQKSMKKPSKRNPRLYEQLLKKIQEVVSSVDMEHYKNLRYSMKDSKRVHVGHFVLVFQHDKARDEILVDDFDHHDHICTR